jgi:hypothetical protein
VQGSREPITAKRPDEILIDLGIHLETIGDAGAVLDLIEEVE